MCTVTYHLKIKIQAEDCRKLVLRMICENNPEEVTGEWIILVLFNKTNRRANFPNLFLSRNSTCFGQFLCPKHIEFLDKNKFWKLVGLLVLLKIYFLRCTVTWTWNLFSFWRVVWLGFDPSHFSATIYEYSTGFQTVNYCPQSEVRLSSST